MNILSKIFSSGANEIIGTVGGIIDNLSASKEEKAQLKERLFDAISSKLLELAEMGKQVIIAESSGNWLQRSWRPIIMLSFGFIIMYYYFIAPVFSTPGIELPNEFWALLKIGLGGYVVGRSVEKVAKEFSKNPDMLKRK